jgi:hypothetical protein
MKDRKIYLVCGFHVNYNHSWRGDRNDRTGFGPDSKIIRGVVDILDEANARGLAARGTWDFDNFWSLESIMPGFAPDLLEAIVRRIKDGPDEAILGCWNNGDVAASTVGEFRENLRRTISNEQGSGVRDMFGSYTPAIRTQETMFTQGSIELYLEQGVEAIALYYSSVPFDAIRNFVPRLAPNQMYNPLWLRSTESDARMLMIPMYNHGDVIDNVSLRRWVKKIRARQESGDIPGNALLYINMDADGEIWTGMPLPKLFGRFPNVRGLPEYIELVNELDYLEFGTIGDYLKNNQPAGELTVRQDLADGSYTGFNSWTEKQVNQQLWRLAERARWLERTAECLSASEGFDPAARREIEKLLYDNRDSYFENKLRLLSTTHFGMNSPGVHEDRLRVAFQLARKAHDFAVGAAALALEKFPFPPTHVADDPLFEFSVVNQPKYKKSQCAGPGTRALVRAPFELRRPCPPECLALKNAAGESVPFDLLEFETDADGWVKSGTLLALHTAGAGEAEPYVLLKGDAERGAGIEAGPGGLSNGLVSVRIDARGRLFSLVSGGNEFSSGQLLRLGATYRIDGRRKYFTPRAYNVVDSAVGPKGRLGRISLNAKVVIFLRGINYTIEADYDLFVFAGMPYVFLDADVRFPETPAEAEDISATSRMKKTFDTNWFEVMPAELKPALKNPPGKFIRVWKHNFKNVTNWYEFDYGRIDHRNRNVDSCNNHVTDGWVAVSDTEKGLLIGFDARANASPACCPMRLREREGAQSVALNPFGTYFGKQFSHLVEGLGFAAEMTRIIGSQHRPTAPSFNGKRVAFRMMLAPYAGDGPDEILRSEAALFSFPPAVVRIEKDKRELIHGLPFEEELAAAVEEHSLDACKGWFYADLLAECNKDLKPGVPTEEQGAGLVTFIRLIAEGIKMRP